jgi:ankyrin repeat protein
MLDIVAVELIIAQRANNAKLLAKAIESGNEAEFDRLVLLPIDPNEFEGEPPIYAACRLRREDMAIALLGTNMCNIWGARSDDGYNTFHLACRMGLHRFVGLLVKHFRKMCFQNTFRHNPLAYAAASGSVETVNVLLDTARGEKEASFTENFLRGIQLDDLPGVPPTPGGLSPLGVAITLGRDAVVDRLIDIPGMLGKNSTSIFPAVFAAVKKNATMLRKILDHKSCDPNVTYDDQSVVYYVTHEYRLSYLATLRVLVADPRVDINFLHAGNTPIVNAVSNGCVEFVKIFLGRRDLIFNPPGVNLLVTAIGTTHARQWSTRCLGLLLRDPRASISSAGRASVRDSPSTSERPLTRAVRHVSPEPLQILLASHHTRQLSDLAKKANPRGELRDLLEKFKFDPERTKWELRKKLGLLKEDASDLFAAVVSICDGFLHVCNRLPPRQSDKPKAKEEKTALFNNARFFGIACRLPMELQMLLCNRAYLLDRDSIPTTEFEDSFRNIMVRYDVVRD